MNQRITLFVVLAGLLFGPNRITAQELFSNLPAICLNPEQPSGQKMHTDSIIWVEDILARTEFSSTYYGDYNHIKIIQSKRPINYYNLEGKLVPIDPKLHSLNDYTWSAANQPYPTFLYADGSCSVSLEDSNRMTFGKNCRINGVTLKNNLNLYENSAILEEVSPGIDKEIIFRENGVKYSYVLRSDLYFGGNELVFSEEIEIPDGCMIIRDEDYGRASNGGWQGNLLLIDPKGHVQAVFHLPICFDADHQQVLATYKIRKEEKKTMLDIIVPIEWVNAPERVFPIVIDPLVTGPTSNWTGGTMPSCIMPTYNSDSILVNIPAGITVTQLNVTSSFYADPWTTAVMSDGAMTFSTSCATSQTFTVTGAAGNTAGTAYLDNFNLVAPIMCCFPESCTDTNFYLTMNLGRTGPGTGCNTTYIRYDPFTTSWPFRAEIVGRTPEAYAGQWVVPQTPICSNNCSLTGVAYAQYGVAPYTFSHPWSSQVVTQGQNIGCGTGATTFMFNLDIPNCPDYCDETFTSLSVPPPTIIDACGTVISGMLDEIVPIKTAPQLTASYDTLVCSNELFNIDLISCVAGADITWSGNGDSGTSDISSSVNNTSASILAVDYIASAQADGCYSDTLTVPLYVVPQPVTAYSSDPDPIISGVPVTFSDLTQFNPSSGTDWLWIFGDGNGSLDQHPSHLYASPGEYELCLIVTNASDCMDSLCEIITVVPAEIEGVNVITANNDGVNDFLAFKYLEFYPNNELIILNRWGNEIHRESGYKNNWNGAGFAEGVYFYVLKVPDADKEYSGFFHIVE